MTKVKDPVEEKVKAREAKAVENKLQAFDISKLTLKDFKKIPKSVAKGSHPFDGYPIKKAIKISEYKDLKTQQMVPVMVSPTFIVGLNPTYHVPQDRSGQNQSLEIDGKEHTFTIETTHNRVVQDFESGGQNIDVEFGRKITLSDGTEMRISVVPSHSARAQLVFKLDKNFKTDTDDRYLLLDDNQKKPLQRLFGLLNNPTVRRERLSAAVSGELPDDEAEQVLVSEGLTPEEK